MTLTSAAPASPPAAPMDLQRSSAAIDVDIARTTRRRTELETRRGVLAEQLRAAQAAHGRAIAENDEQRAAALRGQVRALRDEEDGIRRALEHLEASADLLAGERRASALLEARDAYQQAETIAVRRIGELHDVVTRLAPEILAAADRANEASEAATRAGGNLRRAGEEPPVTTRRDVDGWGRHPELGAMVAAVRSYAGDARAARD